jgi:hypothetical protein
MKRILTLVTIVSLLTAVTVTDAFAQGRMRDRPNPTAPSARIYDTATVETISGEAIGVDRIPSRRGRGYGVHVTVRTETETIEVRLGPQWYLDRNQLNLEVGDAVEITGSRISQDDTSFLIAASIQTAERAIVLRDESGIPLWSGRNRR